MRKAFRINPNESAVDEGQAGGAGNGRLPPRSAADKAKTAQGKPAGTVKCRFKANAQLSALAKKGNHEDKAPSLLGQGFSSQ